MKKRSLTIILALLMIAAALPIAAFAAPAPDTDFYFDSGNGTIGFYVGPGGDVEIPAAIGGVNVTAIGDGAFFDTGITSVLIPAGVTSIYNGFGYCGNLTTVNFANDTAIEALGEGSFCYCTKLPSFTVPASVKNIDACAFEGCSALTEVIFEDGSALNKISLCAFLYCYALKNITIPAGVTEIQERAFKECSALTEVTILAENPPTLGSNVFAADNNLSVIKVPAASLDAYKTAWSEYADLFQPLPEVVAYNATKKTEYESLADALAKAENGDEIELRGKNNAERVILPTGVTLYANSDFTGSVDTNEEGKKIDKKQMTGNFQYVYTVVDDKGDLDPVPPTGDISDSGMWAALMCISFALVISCAVSLKKKRRA